MKFFFRLHYWLYKWWGYIGHKNNELISGTIVMALLLSFYAIYIIGFIGLFYNVDFVNNKSILYLSFVVLLAGIHLITVKNKDLYMEEVRRYRKTKPSKRKKHYKVVSIFVISSFSFIFVMLLIYGLVYIPKLEN